MTMQLREKGTFAKRHIGDFGPESKLIMNLKRTNTRKRFLKAKFQLCFILPRSSSTIL